MRRVLLLCGLLLVLAQVGLAAVPGLVQYQGRVTSPEGTALDGTYNLTFAVYDAAEQGTLQWSETHSGVIVDDGLFNVVLGSLTPLSDAVFAGPERFLEVQINGEPVLPRNQLTATGYSYRVGTVDGASGGTILDSLVIMNTGNAQFGKVPSGTTQAIRLGFGQGSGSLDFYEPIDSKVAGSVAEIMRLQILPNSLIMFSETGSDTILVIEPNGDITSKGQLTMGENSSPGFKTTVLGFQNTAIGDSSTIGGGSANVTTGTSSVIAGGHANNAAGTGSVISGGAHNSASGEYATISGGQYNSAAGDWGIVPGGQNNSADGLYSYAAGRKAKAMHDGSFVWADHTDEDFTSTEEDQFIVRAKGGVGIGTASPVGLLDVAGYDGDTSVNVPNDAISSPEILNEPGLATTWLTSTITLPQDATQTQALASVTMTLPAPGYVVLRGSATLEVYGTNKRNQAYVQISETPSSGGLGPFYRVAGMNDGDSPDETHYFDMTNERVFFLAAGSHSFVLEGLAHPENGAGAVGNVIHPQLTAIYYPTSYGTVAGFVTSTSASEFDEAALVSWYRSTDGVQSVVKSQYYQVDLRELEQEVLLARNRLQEAEQELQRAKAALEQ